MSSGVGRGSESCPAVRGGYGELEYFLGFTGLMTWGEETIYTEEKRV